MGRDAELRSLIEALELLAAEPTRQVGALADFRSVAREIQDGVTELVQLDERLAGQGRIGADVQGLVRTIDERIDAMLDRDDLWSEAGLRGSDEWRGIRQLARSALAALR